MSNPQINSNPSPRGLNAGVKPKYYIWIEEVGIVGETESPEEYMEEWIELDEYKEFMEELLGRVFPWEEGITVGEIKRNGRELIVKYKYEDEGVEKEKTIYIQYDLFEIDDQVGYWDEIIRDLKESKIDGKITRAWRLERIIYQFNRGLKTYWDDPSIVVILEVLEQ